MAAVLLLLPVVVAAVWSGNRLRLERADEVEAEAGRLATTATALLAEYFASLDGMASLLVRHPAVVAMDAGAARPVFARLLSEQPLLSNVVLRDANARLVLTMVDRRDRRPAAGARHRAGARRPDAPPSVRSKWAP